jgi:protein TonB
MNTHVAERRPLGALGRMGVVGGLHLAVIYLVATSLGIVPKLQIADPIEGRIIPSDPIPVPPPDPVGPPDTTSQIRVQLDPPVAPPPDTVEDSDAIGAEFVPDPIPTPPVDRSPQPELVGVRQDARYPLTRPPYPPSAVRAEQQGAVEIEVYVLPNGRVGDARVVKSTGHPVLDQSALDEARRRWRLMPATRDGVPYAQWHKMRVVFDLRDR